ncbi:DUF2158 domain-containing protein [Chryseobacterium sediminis]|uniref:DUF2158 domain-containing protein n=1 Tax=Chryseobacterium sediminis TaxID=1679494 RepID=A0A5B2U9N7_9FLAO|nr:DUF2158 domain-containing protein [Chryseobacterium sediminis]KAA2223038.1 DUF2158 domain-containing protein [Chryseobacterium sediminis]
MIKKGDVVKLKSGGPKMTVKGLAGVYWVCSWFVGEELKEGMFTSEQFEILN